MRTEEIQAQLFLEKNVRLWVYSFSAQLSREVFGVVLGHLRLLHQTLTVRHALAKQADQNCRFRAVRVLR